jgi:3-oxoadipate enol-lactonase
MTPLGHDASSPRAADLHRLTAWGSPMPALDFALQSATIGSTAPFGPEMQEIAVELAYTAYGTEAVLERRGCAVRYWVREASRADAPLVMFIHGAGVDHRMWASQIDEFADRYRILTFDLRGHGLSRPASEYGFDLIVDDGFALLDQVNAAKVALVGLSMGGNVAQEMVFRDPRRFSGVICADCTCNTLVPFFDRLLVPVYRTLFGPLLALYPMETLVRRVGQSSALTPNGQRYVSTATAQLTKSELALIMTTLLAALHHERDYEVRIPQLLCCGEHDQLGNIRKVMPKWRRRDPQSELVVIPNASHCSNIDNPALFNRIAMAWLGRTFDLGEGISIAN